MDTLHDDAIDTELERPIFDTTFPQVAVAQNEETAKYLWQLFQN